MEYLNNHNEITKIEYKILMDFTINSLKSDSDNGISDFKAIDNIRRKISKDFIETNFIYKYKEHFEEVHRIYRLSLSNYDKNKVDVVKSVLRNEAHEEFLNRSKITKIQNFKYEVDFDTITYNKFIQHLLQYDVYRNCDMCLGQNFELYKLIYNNNKYDEFTFEKFEGHVVNSDLYKKMYSEIYPDKTLPNAIFIDNDLGFGYYEIIEGDILILDTKKQTNEINEKESDELKTLKFNLSKFTEDEKIFLLHVCYKAKIPQTEFVKLMLITNNIEDISVFYENPSNNKLYRKFNEGIEYLAESKKRDFINHIIEKIEYFNLKSFKNELNLIKKKIK